jgi:hypothetical protein
MTKELSSIAFVAAFILLSSLKKSGEIINGYKKSSSSAIIGISAGNSL